MPAAAECMGSVGLRARIGHRMAAGSQDGPWRFRRSLDPAGAYCTQPRNRTQPLQPPGTGIETNPSPKRFRIKANA